MRSPLLAAGALLLCLVSAPTVRAQSADSTKAKTPTAAPGIEGKWRGSITTPNGAQDVNCTIKKEKDGYVGTISGVDGDVPLRDITVEGDKVTAGAVMSMQGTNIEIWYTFLFKDDALGGTAAVSFGGQSMSFDLVLKRATEK